MLPPRSKRRYVGVFAAHWEAMNAGIAATASLPDSEREVLCLAFLTLVQSVPPEGFQLDMAQLRLGFESCVQVRQASRGFFGCSHGTASATALAALTHLSLYPLPVLPCLQAHAC